jgi:hypothetical protein
VVAVSLVPNLNTFLHKLLIKCCETLYYEPQTINFEKSRVIEIISIAIEDTIANQIPIEYILNEYLAGAFDEEPDEQNLQMNELKLEEPEMLDEEVSDHESAADSEEGEYKNIPILPIKNRPGFQESLNTDHNIGSTNSGIDLDRNISPENENENETPEIKTKNEPTLNKSTKIEDNSDEEYSDEDLSGEELSDDEDPKVKKNRSLF